MIDINLSRVFDIFIDSPIIESNSNKNSHSVLYLPEYSPCIQIDTKIIIACGLYCRSLSKVIINNDFSLFKFEYEKVRENNILPRFKH